MADIAAEGAEICPTCLEGRCPPINTTPGTPKPPDSRVKSATKAIPEILLAECQVDCRYEVTASRLVELLMEPRHGGHLHAASEWAIHGLIQQRRLTPHAAYRNVKHPDFGKRRRFVEIDGEWMRERHAFITEAYPYGDEPAGFGTFVVRATDGLWSWWREQESASPDSSLSDPVANTTTQSAEQNDKTYSPHDLRKELNITSPTLHRYMQLANVEPPGKGHHECRYTPSQRIKILKAVAKNARRGLAKIASELLLNETNIKGK
jgi:hypothetical protein